MKKMVLISLVLLVLVAGGVGLYLVVNKNQKEEPKSGTPEDRKKVEQNVGDLLKEKTNFKKIISDELKKREPAGNKQLLEQSQSSFKTTSINYSIENLQVTEDTASCVATTERVLENSKTGFKMKLTEKNLITLESFGQEWKITGIEALSADSEILRKPN